MPSRYLASGCHTCTFVVIIISIPLSTSLRWWLAPVSPFSACPAAAAAGCVSFRYHSNNQHVMWSGQPMLSTYYACPNLFLNANLHLHLAHNSDLLMSSMLFCRWQDDYPDSWEAEESISPDIVAIWEQKQKQQSGEAQHTSSSSSNGSSLQSSSQPVSQL